MTPFDGLEEDLTRALANKVDFSTTRRAEYSADASNYRRIPLGVVFPSSAKDVIKTVEICRSWGTAITLRGGGTSVAGNAIGDGVIIDCSRFFNRVLNIDPEQQTVYVEPGVVLDDLQVATSQHGLQFGPDPSTHSRCTIGGMIGNNSCGARSLTFGRTVDNVIELDVLLYDGTLITLKPTSTEELKGIFANGDRRAELYKSLHALCVNNESLIRSRMGLIGRQISGYSLEHLLPENKFNPARALVGTEGTCAIVLRAKLQLVKIPRARSLIVLGFNNLGSAADAVPALLPYSPTAIEGMDAQIVEVLRQRRPDFSADTLLPLGNAWLLVEFSGENQDEVNNIVTSAKQELTTVAAAIESRTAITTVDQKALWQIREDGAGLASRMADGSEAWPGWEDAAVPPAQLGAYIRQFQELMLKYNRKGAIYGHFGEGCVHTRIDFDFTREVGVNAFRAFVTDACKLVGEHEGSFSGEHGDGFARSEFLPLMYGNELTSVFKEFKSIWDPDGKLNPEIIVDPALMDEHLRVDPRRHTLTVKTTLAFAEDDGDFDKAIRRCVGVGKCRSDTGGVMCPSFRATHDERDSTRGRARVLHEMLQGEVIVDGWRSKEALDALDLCLSCKGCKTDCPVNVDMATYKAEFLNNHYSGRIRPRSHYSLGWLPLWVRAASKAPRLVNRLAKSPLGTLAKSIGGIAPQRPLPEFAHQTFRQWFDTQNFPPQPNDKNDKAEKQVLLWVDTLTNYLSPEIGQAAVKVLHAAGYSVLLPPDKKVCCGLTWISTGQLHTARRAMSRSLDAIGSIVSADIPMVGLEPSCTAVFRSDVVDLLANDPRSKQVAENTFTLAEFLDSYASDWKMPKVSGTTLTQTHCHQHAIMGTSAEKRIMARLRIDNSDIDKGCCGLAGNFGYEKNHYDVSVAIAEAGLLPEVRSASPETLIVAEGFSCRTQIEHLSNKKTLHLAEIIAMHL